MFIFLEGKYTCPIILYMYFMSRQTLKFSTNFWFFDTDSTKTAIHKFQLKHLLYIYLYIDSIIVATKRALGLHLIRY